MAFSQAQGIGPFIGIVALAGGRVAGMASRMLTSQLARVSPPAWSSVARSATSSTASSAATGCCTARSIDFIDLQWFPIFNVADMAIDIGGVMFVLWTMLGHRRTRAA